MAREQGQDAPTLHLGLSHGLCRECRTLVDARYVSDGSSVFLERICLDHGRHRARVAESLSWFLEVSRTPGSARAPDVLVHRGDRACPEACGPCEMHAQRCNLPVLSITNACNLRCPICFTFNRADRRYFLSREEFRRQMEFVVRTTGGVDLVNVTGGEPTLHPDLLGLLEEARRPGIGRVTLNSNGVVLARDPEMARRLAEMGVYVILSLNTLDPQRSVRLHGVDLTAVKRGAIENLARFGVPTTILMVLVAGVNENELEGVLDLALTSPFVRSLTIQTMAYTGQGGGSFGPRQHIPVDEAERRVAEASRGRVRRSDFLPLPTAHPLCYGVAYLLLDDQGGVCSFTDIVPPATIARHLVDGYLLQPTAALEEDLRAAIDRLWVEDDASPALRAVRSMFDRLYPAGRPLDVHERQRRAERDVKTIYVHAHMDEDTWEVGRAMRCPDQVPLDAERMIGACNYNLFYRMRDERFWVPS